MIVLDVWGGEMSSEHLARYVLASEPAATALAIHELRGGFLVNLRNEVAWGPGQSFDHRVRQ